MTAFKIFHIAIWLTLVNLVAGCSDQNDHQTTAPLRPASDVAIAGGVFVSQIPNMMANGSTSQVRSCAIDTVNSITISEQQTWHIRKTQQAHLSGWAFDSTSGTASEEIFVRLSGNGSTYYALTTTRGVRDDVAKVMSIDPAVKAGYVLRANIDQVVPGTYQISILQPQSQELLECVVSGKLIVE